MARAVRLRHRWLIVATCALVVSACQVADPNPGETLTYPSAPIPKALDNVHYGPEEHEVLDVYAPSSPNGGAILWIHGGGWADSDSGLADFATEEPPGMQPVVEELYRRGWTVFSMRYAGTDEAPFPAQIHDAKLALRWVKSRADEFGVSPNSVIAMGWSSGGHLAALLGVSAGSLEPPNPPAELAGISSRPAAVVSIAGVLDPATFPYQPGLPPGNASMVAALVGCPGTPDLWQSCNPALLAATRPTSYDDAGDAPIYITVGDRDGIVDPHWQAAVPYTDLVSTMGDSQVWLDVVNGGDPAAFGGDDPRNHTKATSYALNMWALGEFVRRYLPATPPPLSLLQFVPLTPCRLGDTRIANPFRRVAAGTFRVQVSGQCGVPSNARAVAATVTVVRPTQGGAISAAPSGAPSGLPILTFNTGDVRANSGMVTLSSAGQIDLTGVVGSIIVDVTGAFVPSATATAGRYTGVEPIRLLDTREGSGVMPVAGTVTTVDVTEAGVPSDATAVAVNLTAIRSVSAGYLTAMAEGSGAPVASALNVDGPGETRGGFVVVPVRDGRIAVLQSMAAHLTVDVAGYFTGASAMRSRAGLYRTNPSFRAFDSRTGAGFAPLVERPCRSPAPGPSRWPPRCSCSE
ncbi:MAG: alpha/beta hydrolase [Actinobacteria bacterium]|nr:alpha/beta hydrolase [Actinomycetota bacterium]